jgi:hypothetical protein
MLGALAHRLAAHLALPRLRLLGLVLGLVAVVLLAPPMFPLPLRRLIVLILVVRWR